FRCSSRDTIVRHLLTEVSSPVRPKPAPPLGLASARATGFRCLALRPLLFGDHGSVMRFGLLGATNGFNRAKRVADWFARSLAHRSSGEPIAFHEKLRATPAR